MKKNTLAPKCLAVLSFFVYLYIWAPVIVIIVFSFSTNIYGEKWEHFTLKWYFELFRNAAVKEVLIRSLIIAIAAVIMATIIGTITAYGLFKLKFKGKQFLRTAILLPMVLPGVVLGGALLIFFTRLVQIPLGYPSIIIAHIVFCTPLSVFVILGRMQRIDWALEEAAMDLGATRFRTFRRVTGPLLLPAIASSAMLIFPWSFHDFVITYFVTGVGSTTLPIYVFSQMRYGATPVINTIGSVFIAITFGTVILSLLIQKREKNTN